MTSVSRAQALATAERLLDTEEILAAVPAGGFLNGLAGTALLHARLAAVDSVFAQAALRHWTAAAQNSGPCRGAAGTFSSPGGLAASLIIGSAYLPDPDAQRIVTARAVRWLAACAVDLAQGREEHLRSGGVGTPWPMYDAINGLAGIGRVLLAALTAGYDTAESGLLAALRTLTSMIDTPYGRRPGWWLPAGDQSSAVIVHPSGAATTGMAHGIAGPVSTARDSTLGWMVRRWAARRNPERGTLAAALAHGRRAHLDALRHGRRTGQRHRAADRRTTRRLVLRSRRWYPNFSHTSTADTLDDQLVATA